jgi:hypothetical protein
MINQRSVLRRRAFLRLPHSRAYPTQSPVRYPNKVQWGIWVAASVFVLAVLSVILVAHC